MAESQRRATRVAANFGVEFCGSARRWSGPITRLSLKGKTAYTYFVALGLDDIRRIIEARDFQRLIGEVEGQFFDAKSQPYAFEGGADAKREFAKDVAGFANALGGCVIVGVATKLAELRAAEEVTEIRPVGHKLFSPERHRKILSEWVYPRLKDLDIRWVQYGDDPHKGIGVIFVPAQSERSRPFLITRAMGDKKSTEILVGYAERRTDMTEPRSVVEIHQALRTGMNLERELLGRIENIELVLERHLSAAKAADTAEKKAVLLRERIARLLQEGHGR